MASPNRGAVSWRPTGRPAGVRPHGSERAGTPQRFAVTVSTSERYIASGSAAFSPSAKAAVGVVALARRSTFRKHSSISWRIAARTFWARP